MLILIEMIIFIFFMYECIKYIDSNKGGYKIVVLGLLNFLILYEIHPSYGYTIGLYILLIAISSLFIFKK